MLDSLRYGLPLVVLVALAAVCALIAFTPATPVNPDRMTGQVEMTETTPLPHATTEEAITTHA